MTQLQSGYAAQRAYEAGLDQYEAANYTAAIPAFERAVALRSRALATACRWRMIEAARVGGRASASRTPGSLPCESSLDGVARCAVLSTTIPALLLLPCAEDPRRRGDESHGHLSQVPASPVDHDGSGRCAERSPLPELRRADAGRAAGRCSADHDSLDR
jgi:hypothetical protein